MFNYIGIGFAIIGLFYLIVWWAKNDGARSPNEQTGLFRMRRVEGSDEKKNEQKKRPGSVRTDKRRTKLSR